MQTLIFRFLTIESKSILSLFSIINPHACTQLDNFPFITTQLHLVYKLNDKETSGLAVADCGGENATDILAVRPYLYRVSERKLEEVYLVRRCDYLL